MKKHLALAIACAALLSTSAFGQVSVSVVTTTATPVASPADSPTPAPEPTEEPAETEAAVATEVPVAETEEPSEDETTSPAAEVTSGAETEVEAEVEPLTELTKKSRGKAVKKLQESLIEKGYLSDEADGVFGSLTKSAVMLLQYQNGMEITGIADVALQEFLFSDECPDCVEYAPLVFDTEEPDLSVSFNGRVLQAIEGKETVLRVATRGAYEDVVYITYTPVISEQNFSVGDRITVYGTTAGPITYRNTSGNSVTMTHIEASLITDQ